MYCLPLFSHFYLLFPFLHLSLILFLNYSHIYFPLFLTLFSFILYKCTVSIVSLHFHTCICFFIPSLFPSLPYLLTTLYFLLFFPPYSFTLLNTLPQLPSFIYTLLSAFPFPPSFLITHTSIYLAPFIPFSFSLP